MRYRVVSALAFMGIVPIATPAQQPTRALVFDSVTVVDVAHGTLLPERRVVIVNHRIQRVGPVSQVHILPGARVIAARGKYLIPGLWDMHVHTGPYVDIFYPLLLANGVTGIRNPGSEVPLHTLHRWRREVLLETRIGPPRQLFSGPSLAGPEDGCVRSQEQDPQTCVSDEADGRHMVDSLKAAGADFIKLRAISTASLYYAMAAEARRVGMPFGGHIQWETGVTATEASDSGATILDHTNAAGGLDSLCYGIGQGGENVNHASFAKCRAIAEHLRRNNTWHVPTLVVDDGVGQYAKGVLGRFQARAAEFWNGASLYGNWLRDSVTSKNLAADSLGIMHILVRAGIPIVSGTDIGPQQLFDRPPGFGLHAELAMYQAEGMTPLEVLQAATLNPARLLHATDSLGTVAPGKYADLILLDANPLLDITNTTTIRAVVANGRYFDRVALDSLLAVVRARAKIVDLDH